MTRRKSRPSPCARSAKPWPTGCRISEALELTADRVDLNDGVLVFESLKKRRKGVFRAIPVPPAFLTTLDQVHGLRTARARDERVLLWDWSRVTAWRRVCEIMDAADKRRINWCWAVGCTAVTDTLLTHPI